MQPGVTNLRRRPWAHARPSASCAAVCDGHAGRPSYIIISLDAFTDLCVYDDTRAVYDDTGLSMITLWHDRCLPLGEKDNSPSVVIPSKNLG